MSSLEERVAALEVSADGIAKRIKALEASGEEEKKGDDGAAAAAAAAPAEAAPAAAAAPPPKHPAPSAAEAEPAKSPAAASSGEGEVVMLITPMPSNQAQEQGMRKMRSLLEAKKIAYREVDGIEQKEERNALFAISEKRGVYPQVFIYRGEDKIFVGDYAAILELNEMCDIPAEILAQNPQIKTFNQVFAAFM